MRERIDPLEARFNKIVIEHNRVASDFADYIKNTDQTVSNLCVRCAALEHLVEAAEKNVRKANSEASWALIILLSIVSVIIAVCAFVFWPHKTKPVSILGDMPSRLKCPRCGWEHVPGDTICKNPDCKTQF